MQLVAAMAIPFKSSNFNDCGKRKLHNHNLIRGGCHHNYYFRFSMIGAKASVIFCAILLVAAVMLLDQTDAAPGARCNLHECLDACRDGKILVYRRFAYYHLHNNYYIESVMIHD